MIPDKFQRERAVIALNGENLIKKLLKPLRAAMFSLRLKKPAIRITLDFYKIRKLY